MTTFVLHPQLAKDTALIGRIGECLLLLMKDARYPWLILVPEQEGLRELHDLSDDQFSSVTQIIKQTSLRLQTLTEALKINVAALGNMVPQLHIHIIARREDDASWPGPVWGVGTAEPYTEDELTVLVATLKESLLA
jgi:diadenosine tetraphosphate (Ap4A) HIT family hydrolase